MARAAQGRGLGTHESQPAAGCMKRCCVARAAQGRGLKTNESQPAAGCMRRCCVRTAPCGCCTHCWRSCSCSRCCSSSSTCCCCCPHTRGHSEMRAGWRGEARAAHTACQHPCLAACQHPWWLARGSSCCSFWCCWGWGWAWGGRKGCCEHGVLCCGGARAVGAGWECD